MTTPAVQVERRAGQRFSYLLPLSICQAAVHLQSVGFTQDVSSRGVFFFTDAPLAEGAEIELTLRMPSEITLGESMPIRCRGRILRVVRPPSAANSDASRETKIGVAVRIEGYEYLPETSESSVLPRVSTLHPQQHEPRPPAQSSVRSVLG